MVVVLCLTAPGADITHLDVDIITFARMSPAPPPNMFFSQLPLLLVIMIQLGLGQACELSLGVSQKRS